MNCLLVAQDEFFDRTNITKIPSKSCPNSSNFFRNGHIWKILLRVDFPTISRILSQAYQSWTQTDQNRE